MGYRWILFDADDTLFDYNRSATVALQSTLEDHGHEFTDDHWPTFVEINRRFWHRLERGEIDQDGLRVARFEEFLATCGVAVDCVATFSARYETQLGGGTHLIDGAAELVERLASRVSLMMITNGLTNVQRARFAAAPLTRHFADYVISEEIGVSKPEPGIFDVAFAKMGNPSKRDVLIVGDSLSSDMQGGSDYGIDTCWFNPHGKPLDRDVRITHEVRTLAEVEDISS